MEERKRIRDLPVDCLTFWDENPRTITEAQMKKLCKSIKEDPHFFDMRPILVNSHKGVNLIYAGNQRARAAISLGYTEVPCFIDIDLPESIMKKRSIMDNKTYGQWNLDMLANEWDSNFLLECGFTEQELCFDKLDKKEDQKKFRIILEFKNEDSLNDVLPEINKLKALCQIKVKT